MPAALNGKPNYTRELTSSLLSVGASLRTVGATLVEKISSGYEHLTADSSDKEKIDFVKFGFLEYWPQRSGLGVERHRVLLLGYQNGFQVWDVQDCNNVRELVSRRDGPVRFTEPVPLPQEPDKKGSPLYNYRPILAIVPVDTISTLYGSEEGEVEDGAKTCGLLQLYSLHTHSYVHTLKFTSRVLSVRCSTRMIVVALDAQIHAFDSSTLERVLTAVTYPAPCTKQLMLAETCNAGTAVPLALGPRWLAYASNQVGACYMRQ
jgi:hypothetical protein